MKGVNKSSQTAYTCCEVITMNILGWLIIGALAGWIASMITGNNRSMGALANVCTGVVGAVIGGWVMNLIGGHGVTGFNIWSLIVAIIGAVILLWCIHAIRRRT